MDEQSIEHEPEVKMPETPTRSTTLTIPIAIIIAGALVAGAIYFTSTKRVNSLAAAPGAPSQPQTQTADISKVQLTGRPFIGNPNARITVAYWYDYQCPFCKQNEETAMPQLIKDYVDTGKAKIVFKDYQFLGPDSQTAGLAEHAVWEVAPDKFYQWHKAMYNKQDRENSGWGKKSDILTLTKSLGIDSAKVDQLMTSKATEYQKMMDDDKAEGTAFGVSGTPSFIIGKQLLIGAQPYPAIKQLIDLVQK